MYILTDFLLRIKEIAAGERYISPHFLFWIFYISLGLFLCVHFQFLIDRLYLRYLFLRFAKYEM